MNTGLRDHTVQIQFVPQAFAGAGGRFAASLRIPRPGKISGLGDQRTFAKWLVNEEREEKQKYQP